MRSILLWNVRVCRPQFKGTYLKCGKHFGIFFFSFWNLHQILNILKKKMIVIATLFRKLQTVRDLFTPLCKNSVSEYSLTVNKLKRPKLLQKEHERTFIIIFQHSEKTSVENYLTQLYLKS